MTGENHNHEVRVALLESGMVTINDKLTDMKSVLERVAIALERMATIEERQKNTNEGLARAFGEIEDHDERIVDIETKLPELMTIKSWVIRGVLAVASLVGVGTIGAVFSMAFMAQKAAGGG